ncbi:hypothetical protein V5O48_018167 [Marasmius crinis-equi]|uniref:Nephrocystin 3-like N-terminal domain-containing protein n=1 Tax=Marasmius crinis-equi TaxID=585013 RepID=A0ABR3ELY1_9AGAR
MQNIHSGNDQNIHAGNGHIFTGEVNVAGSFVQMVNPANVAGPNAHRTLWDAVAGIGASHRAEQQFSRGECLEGTRERALRIIHAWRLAKERDLPICWLSGAAGVGKSAIAMTIAKSCEEDGLVSSFFLFRSDPRRNNPSGLMLTIAHGLVVTIPRLEPVINGRITADPKILEATLELQFRELILKPSLPPKQPDPEPVRKLVRKPWWRRLWRRTKRALADDRDLPRTPENPGFIITPTTSDPNLVIIDGLDECSDSTTQLRILATIRDSYQHTPHFPLRFLICSRPESWIRQAFKAQPLRDITQSIVLDDTFSPAKDIERYLIHELEGIRESPEYEYMEFPTPWPSQEDYDCLVKRSDGQFVYVVTAVKFVKIPHCNPVKQLRVIIANPPVKSLTKSPYPELDNLYHVILAANPDHDMVLIILAAILLLPHDKMDKEGRTQSPEWLGLLLGLSPGEVILALRAMHSVLDIRGPTDRIRVYHTSFTDYLSDQTRSGEFCMAEQRYNLAQRWLQALSRDRIGGYSPKQLYGRPTIFFFTGWISCCVSLPEPTPALLEDLGNLDLSALFFCRLASRGHSLVFSSMSIPLTPMSWDEAFKELTTWLSSSVNPTAGILAKGLREQPKVFHIEPDDAFDLEDIQGTESQHIDQLTYVVSAISGFYPDISWDGLFTYSYPSFRVTGCYCHDMNVNPTTTSSCHPGHRLYQSVCLRILRGFMLRFRTNPRGRHDFHPENLLNSSLLLHCPFEPELFSLCGTFFELLGNHFQPNEDPRNIPQYRTKLLDWLETCPDCYAREAEALRAQIISVFCEADEAHGNAGELASIREQHGFDGVARGTGFPEPRGGDGATEPEPTLSTYRTVIIGGKTRRVAGRGGISAGRRRVWAGDPKPRGDPRAIP